MSRQTLDDNPTVLVGGGGQAAGPGSAPPTGPSRQTQLLVGAISSCLIIVLLLACGGAAWYFLAGPGKTSVLPTPTEPTPTIPAQATVAVATVTATATATETATREAPTAQAATPAPSSTETPTVSAPAQVLAFASDRTGNYDIYVADANAPDSPKDLTADSAGAERHPSWSPDGKQIAFASDRGGKFEIYVMAADGSNVKQLTQDGPNTQPAWSHDGGAIAYAHQLADGTRDVYVMKSDGSGAHAVANDPHDDFKPQWSPDGKQIVFLTNRDLQSLAGTGEIYVKPSDAPGGDVRVTPSIENALSVDFSPDGQRLIFAGKPDPNGKFQVYTIQPGGQGLSQLSIVAANETYPAFTPDGTHIVYVSARDGTNNIFIMNADGFSQLPLTHATGDNIEPVWQPAP